MNVRASICLSLLFVASTMGCGPDTEVTSRSVVRQEEPKRPVDVEAVREQMQHTLVAILPIDDVAWFFKISGPSANVEAVKDDFMKLIAALKPAESKDKPPAWELPEGWEETGAARMRAATIKIPGENGGEITVSSLPLSGKWDEFLYMNVERWMRQLRHAPLSLETIHKLSKEVESDAGKATVLHLAGRPPAAERPNPHASMAKKPPAKAPSTETADKDKKVAAPSAPTGPLQYKTPEGWQPGRMSAMRKAAFNVVDGDQSAEVTVFDFPTQAGPMITDPVANVQRWAGEVGIQGLDAEKIGELTETFKIDGLDGTYVELLGSEEGGKARASLAAMVTKGEKIWFFKIHGDKELVEQQREAFSAFLKSVSIK